MQPCVWYDHWPPREPTSATRAAHNVALPWDVLAHHVTARDLDGRAFQATLDRENATLQAVLLPPLVSLTLDAFERETDDHYMRMQVAERVGAPYVILSSGHHGAIGFDATVDAITRLAALAERMDVRILLRNTLGSALEQPDAFDALFRRVQSQDLGVCLDVDAFDRARINPADMVLRFADRLGALWFATATDGSISNTASNALDEARSEAFDGLIIADPNHLHVFRDWYDR